MLQEYETLIESLQRQVDLAQSVISSGGSIWEGERMLTSSLMEFRKFSLIYFSEKAVILF